MSSYYALVNPSSNILLDVVTVSSGSPFVVPSPYVWKTCLSTTTQANSYYNSGTGLVTAGAPPGVTNAAHYVQKNTIRNRMVTAGLQAAYDAALAGLTADQSNNFAEMIVFSSTNALINTILTTAGATIATILAPDPQASQRFGGT